LTIRDVGWNDRRVTDLMESDLVLSNSLLRLPTFSTRIAHGQLIASLDWDLQNPRRSPLELQINRLSIDELIDELIADRQEARLPARGTLSGFLRGRIGETWHGTGQLSFMGGEVAEIPIQQMQGPFQWSYTPATSAAYIQLRLASVRLAHGRVTGELTGRWSGRLELEGRVKIERADVRVLAKAVPQINDVISGRLSGEAEFDGWNVRSFDDLDGTFHARLDRSQAMMFPVLNAFTTWLGIPSPASEVFRKTDATGRFGRGVLQIEQMTMESPDTRLFIEGRLTTRGRLDMNVTADTTKVATAGVALGLLRPTDLLRRRLIFLHAGGSIRNPIVRPRTVEFIKQEILLFFWPLSAPTE
jgi:hypothetical protein